MVWWVIAAAAAKSVLGSDAQIDANVETIKAQRTALAKGITQLNLDRAQSRTRTSAALFNAQQGKQQALSQVGLQANASETIGASVRDAVSTVNINADRENSSILENQRVTEQSFFQKAEGLVDNARANTPTETGGDILFNSLLGSLGSAAGSAAGGAATSSNSEASTYESPNSQPHDYGYSSWGSKVGSTVNSWKSYLGNN